MLEYFLVAIVIVKINADSTFWPNWKIKQCPAKLKHAETSCIKSDFVVATKDPSIEQENADKAYDKTVESEMYNCYVHQVFRTDSVDLMHCKELVSSIEIDHVDPRMAASKKQQFVRSAKRALIGCFERHRLSINHENFAFRKCIYQTLNRVCKAESLYIASDQHPYWHPGLNPYWDKRLRTSGRLNTPPPHLMLVMAPVPNQTH